MASIIQINGVWFDPSGMDFGRQSVSAPDAGRDLTGLMHSMKIAEKETITVSWNYPRPEIVRSALQAVEAREYFPVRYPDEKTGNYVTKTFYVGDRSISTERWSSRQKLYSKLSFKMIER